MTVDTVVVGDFQTNAYVVSAVDSPAALIVDAPGPADQITQRVRERELVPEVLLLTHAHIDHLGGIPHLRELFPRIRIAAGKDAGRMLARPTMNLSAFSYFRNQL